MRFKASSLLLPLALMVPLYAGAQAKSAEQTLREYADTLQALSHRLLDVQEQERRHLARELHDEIGQLLTATIYALENCRRLPADEIAGGVARVQEQVKDLTARVRDLSLRLRPTMLDDFGLQAADVGRVAPECGSFGRERLQAVTASPCRSRTQS